jgi:hypothetical protein
MFRFPIPPRQARSCGTSFTFILALVLIVVFGFPAAAQESASQHDKKLDIQSSVGDLHVGTDADAEKIGLPLYPGARLRHDKEEDSDSGSFAIHTEAFGVKLVVAKYESEDAPGKVIDYYRDKLKKYGKVLECHTHEHGGDVFSGSDDDKDHGSKELKCEGDNTGPVTELKVGTEDNQHLVAVEPRDKGVGSTFAMVYLHVRGKQGEI